jgi:NAD(P)H-hydrate epimerase
MRILNAAQMREADRRTIEDLGIPSLVLMENAGREVVDAVEQVYGSLLDGRVTVLCGRGGNGGDGLVVARTLRQRGVDTTTMVIGALADVRGDTGVNLEILERLGVEVIEVADEGAWTGQQPALSTSSLVIDALVGTGLTSAVGGLLALVIADLNACRVPIVSIDVPSGLSADTPELLGDAVEASMTVALCALKVPLVLPPAEAWAGEVVVADIGIPNEVVDTLHGPRLELLTPDGLRGLVMTRDPDSHKGDYGRVTVVAGSRGKTGAAYLAARGALGSGAGLVTVATPASCLPVVASLGAEFMTEGLAETHEGVVAAAGAEQVLAMRHDVIACGPGLGRTPDAREFVGRLVERAEVPLVLDADALTLVADDPRLAGRAGREVIITPHPGEMASLIGGSVEDVQRDRIGAASAFARGRHVHVVLKGHRTVVATPAGRVFINPTGNPGMATGGTGDVLTGMVAAWFAKLLDAEAACRLAVFLHGLAGDLAAEQKGQVAMTAGDLADHLGGAVARLTGSPDTGAGSGEWGRQGERRGHRGTVA